MKSEDEQQNASAPAQARPAAWLDARTAALVLAVKALVLVFGVQAFVLLQNERPGSLYAWLSLWNRWDAPHYLEVAEFGYRMTGDSRYRLVLFPLYPWLTRLFALLTRDHLVAAFAVSAVASVAAGLLLRRLALLDETEAVARRAVLFLFIFPTSYFLHVPYTESLFLALALGTFLAARTDRWALAGLLGALAGMTRLNGLLLVPALCVEALWQYRGARRWRWHWLWAGAAALGFGCYLLINHSVGGHPLLFLTLGREHWAKTLAWPWVGIGGTLGAATGRGGADALMIGVQELLFTALGLACVVWCWLRQRPSYAVWVTLNWLLFTSVGFVLCVPRFTLVMFPVFILFAKLAEGYVRGAIITAWSLLFLALFAGQFVQGRWAF